MAYKTDKSGGREPPDPFLHPLDAILADIAIAVQLPPGLHAKACERYEAVRTYAEREGSPLHGRILRFYPQGSMAIDATTSTRGTDDEYDLDIVASLAVEPDAPPDTVLDLLFRSIDGYPTSQKVERQTRCVTVRYADRMHLDITPASRLPHGAERESHIFHANPADPPRLHLHVPMNAYGFGEWYRARTPEEERFALAFDERLRKAYGMEVRADAEVDDVPGQVALITKSVTTVALQLLKRFRNIAYATRAGRIPPSVMMSCFAGHAAQPGLALSDMVIRQARLMARELRQASARREKVMVVNPVFQRDCFTDRWPENLSQQEEFAAKLSTLADGLEHMKRNETDPESLRDWLREQFGDYVVSGALRRFYQRAGQAVQGGGTAYTPRGGLYVPSAPALVGLGTATAASSRAIAATPHTFRGGSALIPSIETQIAAMRASWPGLRAEQVDARTVRWRGPLKPLLQTYEVQVWYRAPAIIERIDPLRQQPRVRILSPRLRQRRGDAEGDLPHVYWDDPDCPALCLFDHETGEWTPFHLLAETTIRWAIDWLTCYEGWRVTGEWTGGGRHAEPLPPQDSHP